MKKTIIDISEMSDSKEVYGARPNPMIPAFIYSVFALFMAAVIYCFFGEIEIVSTATGIVRPNDNVSTVSSLIGGRVTGVYYADGQMVRQGETLLTVDTAELQIALGSLQDTRTEYENQMVMIDRFLKGIEQGENPFSPEIGSEEYPYFIQYKSYELAMQSTQDNYEYDAENAQERLEVVKKRIGEIEKKIAGYTAYKSSVEKGSNQAASYPEYESMYQLYAASVEAIDADYKSKKRSDRTGCHG